MKAQKDRHLDAPGEANRDKHINFLAEENGDADPADEKFNADTDKGDSDTSDVDNGFFTDDEETTLQTKKENEEDKSNHPSAEKSKVTPLKPDEQTTLGDKITVTDKNEDILTPVKDDNNTSFKN